MMEAKKASGPARNKGPAGEYDVVVVGFGGAGAPAAIEAAEAGASVLAIDRFDGGGSARLSGGVVYAGGGTEAQKAGKFDDSYNHMLDYMRRESGKTAGDTAIKSFCRESIDIIPWLEKMGVRFGREFFPGRTYQPPGGFGLFYSGNEKRHAVKGRSAPRGHVPYGMGMGGGTLFQALAKTARARGVEFRAHARAVRLLADRGVVTGVEILDLGGNPFAVMLHGALYRAAFLNRSCRRLLERIELRFGKRVEVKARGGVILCGGGFAFSRDMMERFAPSFARSLPLGTPGDDGAAIMMGASAGGELDAMDSCAAYRLFSPPDAFVSGILVNAECERICDEGLDGGTIGSMIARQPGGKAWLLVDSRIMDDARAQAEDDERFVRYPFAEYFSGRLNHLLFRKLVTKLNLKRNLVSAQTLADIEARLGMPRGRLDATVDRYNRDIEEGEPDAFGKNDPDERRYILVPPFFALNCSLGNRRFPDPCMTLGGLRVDPVTHHVMNGAGKRIRGLFAAGRSAAGICSASCPGGLSLAESIVSGRAAGRQAAHAAQAGGM